MIKKFLAKIGEEHIVKREHKVNVTDSTVSLIEEKNGIYTYLVRYILGYNEGVLEYTVKEVFREHEILLSFSPVEKPSVYTYIWLGRDNGKLSDMYMNDTYPRPIKEIIESSLMDYMMRHECEFTSIFAVAPQSDYIWYRYQGHILYVVIRNWYLPEIKTVTARVGIYNDEIFISVNEGGKFYPEESSIIKVKKVCKKGETPMEVTKDTIKKKVYPVAVINSYDEEDELPLDYYRSLGYKALLCEKCGEPHIVRYNNVEYIRPINDKDVISVKHKSKIKIFCNNCDEYTKARLVDPNIAYAASVLITKGYNFTYISEGKPSVRFYVDTDLDDADIIMYDKCYIRFKEDLYLTEEMMKLDPPDKWELNVIKDSLGEILYIKMEPKDKILDEVGIFSKKKLVERISDLNDWVERIPDRNDTRDNGVFTKTDSPKILSTVEGDDFSLIPILVEEAARNKIYQIVDGYIESFTKHECLSRGDIICYEDNSKEYIAIAQTKYTNDDNSESIGGIVHVTVRIGREYIYIKGIGKDKIIKRLTSKYHTCKEAVDGNWTVSAGRLHYEKSKLS